MNSNTFKYMSNLMIKVDTPQLMHALMVKDNTFTNIRNTVGSIWSVKLDDSSVVVISGNYYFDVSIDSPKQPASSFKSSMPMSLRTSGQLTLRKTLSETLKCTPSSML
jgi:hypothetical protein